MRAAVVVALALFHAAACAHECKREHETSTTTATHLPGSSAQTLPAQQLQALRQRQQRQHQQQPPWRPYCPAWRAPRSAPCTAAATLRQLLRAPALLQRRAWELLAPWGRVAPPACAAWAWAPAAAGGRREQGCEGCARAMARCAGSKMQQQALDSPFSRACCANTPASNNTACHHGHIRPPPARTPQTRRRPRPWRRRRPPRQTRGWRPCQPCRPSSWQRQRRPPCPWRRRPWPCGGAAARPAAAPPPPRRPPTARTPGERVRRRRRRRGRRGGSSGR